MAEPDGPLTIAGIALQGRVMLGTARYPSPDVLAKSVTAAGPGFVTVSLRRAGGAGDRFYDIVSGLGVRVVPNTAGCRTAREACATASMARELLGTSWVKLEVIADDETLAPEPAGLLEAARSLCADGFTVLAYCTEDLSLCESLERAGCAAVMPWGSMIGSGRGIKNPDGLALLRERLPDSTLIVDAGIGRPSDAALAMELGYDGVLLNTAVSTARDPVSMAGAFAAAVDAGRRAHLAGPMPRHDMAFASSPAPDHLHVAADTDLAA